MNMSGEPSVTQLIKSMNKFDGTKYIEWQRSTRAIISLMHPGNADIINGVQRPVEISEGVYEGKSNNQLPQDLAAPEPVPKQLAYSRPFSHPHHRWRHPRRARLQQRWTSLDLLIKIRLRRRSHDSPE